MRLRRAQPGRASRKCRERGRNKTMPVRVGLDHAHHGGAGIRTANHAHQMTHVVSQCGHIDDGLRRVLLLGGLIIGLALFG